MNRDLARMYIVQWRDQGCHNVGPGARRRLTRAGLLTKSGRVSKQGRGRLIRVLAGGLRASGLRRAAWTQLKYSFGLA